MRILIDIGHPAHVHLFKHFAWDMQRRGHELLFTCREKEFEVHLINLYGFKYKSFGKKYKSTLGKIWGLIKFDLKEIFTGIKFKPDILISHGSLYAAHASVILGKPHISFEDTFNFEQIRLYKPFTKIILTGDYEHPLISSKVIKYAGYHELAYLYPTRFAPDKSILDELGVNEGDKFVIIRFISWNASHDIGHTGISLDNKIKAVRSFEHFAKVFISSEGTLPIELESNKINISPHRIHDAMSFASLIFGESATMVSEGACLGVPGIYLDNTGRFYTQEEEIRYKLCFNFSESLDDQNKAIKKGIEILTQENSKKIWIHKKQTLIDDKIDVTAFLVWFIENYPTSIKVMKENPSYQLNFK